MASASEGEPGHADLFALARLAGRTAVVTGSTSGIGLGIAQSFARVGMGIVLNGLETVDEAQGLCDQFEREFGTRPDYSPANMAQPDDIAAMITRVSAERGGVDVLVNNAGIQHVAPIEEFPPERWDAIAAINLAAAFHATRAVVPGMKTRGWGRVINVASAHGLVASPFKAAYVAAKHGMLGLTKTVALETAQDDITVNAICPGYVWTPLVEKQIPDTAKARGISEEEVIKNVILSAQPTKQFVTTEQIGALAVFLCSDMAASITGAAIPIDGGFTAQ